MNNNKQQPKVTKYKTSQIVDEYFDAVVMKKRPVSYSFLVKLGADMIKYFIENENAYTFVSFLKRRGMCKQVLYQFCAKCPELQAAKNQVADLIAERLTNGWLEKRMEPSACKTLIPMHDSEVKGHMEWQANVNAKASLTAVAPFAINEPKDRSGSKEISKEDDSLSEDKKDDSEANL